MIEQGSADVPAAGRPSRSDVLRRLTAQIAELHERLGGLPNPAGAGGIWEDIWYEETHHSTAIEGNTLALNQVKLLLREGRAVGNKELREYLEVRGYANAATWVYNQAMHPTGYTRPESLLTPAELRATHYRAMTPVGEVAPHPNARESESPGNFRQHEILPFPGGMKPITFPLIPFEISNWIDQVNVLDHRLLTFPEELAKIHCRFEQIHPFLDGNGRTGRLILNLILVRLGYPPTVIYKRDRTKYLLGLRRADRGDFGQLGELITRGILHNLNRFVVPTVAGPARLVPLTAIASPDLGVEALRAAAARGRLQATRGPDGQWRSSVNWVEEYRTSRYRRS